MHSPGDGTLDKELNAGSLFGSDLRIRGRGEEREPGKGRQMINGCIAKQTATVGRWSSIWPLPAAGDLWEVVWNLPQLSQLMGEEAGILVDPSSSFASVEGAAGILSEQPGLAEESKGIYAQLRSAQDNPRGRRGNY